MNVEAPVTAAAPVPDRSRADRPTADLRAADLRAADLRAAGLRAAGLRVTAVRLAILDALESTPHASAAQVVDHVQQTLGRVSVQAVYDSLHALTGAGLLRRIEPAGSPARYERRVADNHHHVICRACGLTVDVDCAVGEAPCVTPSAPAGFVLVEAEVTWWGLCPACQDHTPQAEPAVTHERETTA
ncbi:MAG: Fur family transcriptional regulator [Actinomycetales bacterium]